MARVGWHPNQPGRNGATVDWLCDSLREDTHVLIVIVSGLGVLIVSRLGVLIVRKKMITILN